MLDKDSYMSTLWRRREFLRICSEEVLAEKAQAIEVTKLVKRNQERLYNINPVSFFINRFWGRQPDGVAINEALWIVHIVECNIARDVVTIMLIFFDVYFVTYLHTRIYRHTYTNTHV